MHCLCVYLEYVHVMTQPLSILCMRALTFAVALMIIESTLLIGRFTTGCARGIRADLNLVEPDLGCSFTLIAHSTERLIPTLHMGVLHLERDTVRIIWNRTPECLHMEGASTETRNSCAMIHPALLPFVKECLLNDALNTQGGVLEIKRPRTRLGAAFTSQTLPLAWL